MPCQNNGQPVSLTLHNYVVTYRVFPMGRTAELTVSSRRVKKITATNARPAKHALTAHTGSDIVRES